MSNKYMYFEVYIDGDVDITDFEIKELIVYYIFSFHGFKREDLIRKIQVRQKIG